MEPPSTEDMQQVYDLIIMLCEHDTEKRKPGARALRTLNRLVASLRAEVDPEDDSRKMSDAEFEALLDLGHACAAGASTLTEKHIDTGVGGGEYEAFVEIGELEYKIAVYPYCRPAEVEAWARGVAHTMGTA